VELKKAPGFYQQQVSGRIARFKEDIASLRRQINAGPSVREELFSSQGANPFDEVHPMPLVVDTCVYTINIMYVCIYY